ncbi:MAG: radical SAM protein [Nitrospirae bacterium]|nr:radical SAM protein [Nitrospirota bacterium]
MDKYRTDSHKLMYHVPRVNDWLSGKPVYPVYMEVSPVGSCNHRCVFCAYDYIGHPNRKLDTPVFLNFIDEISECGVKSLLYAGEGEPLLHSDIVRFITHSKIKGIDVGMYTNGQLMTEKVAEQIVSSLTFIRFSFSGGTDENYAAIHGVANGVFEKVIKNIERVVAIKHRDKLEADIGAQFVLLPENMAFLTEAIRRLRDTGVDYFVIKPFVQQSRMQGYKMSKQFDLKEIDDVLNRAEAFSTSDFTVIARKDSFRDYGKRNYRHCYGTSFISALNSAGDISSCLPYWDNPEFAFGNINRNSFKEIWSGQQREKIMKYLETNLDVNTCSPNCRPNAVNEFLWGVKHRNIKHLNFI